MIQSTVANVRVSCGVDQSWDVAFACRAMDLTEKIKAQVKANTSDRYKLAVQVHIGAMEVRRSARCGCSLDM